MMKRLLIMAVIGCLSALGQTQDAAVSGQIREPGGNPVASIRVTLTRLGGNSRATAVTNNDGSFRIPQVPPGQYTVLAAAFVVTILPRTADAAQAIVYTTRPPFTFFPGTTDASQAEVITVAPASNANINFTLATSPWSDPSLQAVRGRIVVEGGGTPAINSDQFSLFLSDGLVTGQPM